MFKIVCRDNELATSHGVLLSFGKLMDGTLSLKRKLPMEGRTCIQTTVFNVIDKYKVQSSCNRRYFVGDMSCTPVSYTHLDVYKRQP